ncbi:MAG: putative acyltransferase [Mycobacterium sp.]|nr:putative acyltransferase [Mycobacterium sp.]
MCCLWRGTKLVGSAIQTPPYALLCNGLRPAVTETVATTLAESHPALPGVRGLRDAALHFAVAWRRVSGADTTITTEERLYRLGRLSPPTAVAGEARWTRADDADVLAEWLDRFFAEAFGSSDPSAGRAFLEEVTQAGDRVVLWTVADRPVSMAVLRGPIADMSRIGPVYTPNDQRGQGFGSAVTAAASQLALDVGARRDRRRHSRSLSTRLVIESGRDPGYDLVDPLPIRLDGCTGLGRRILQCLVQALLDGFRAEPQHAVLQEDVGEPVVSVERYLDGLGFVCRRECFIVHLVKLVIHHRLQPLSLLQHSGDLWMHILGHFDSLVSCTSLRLRFPITASVHGRSSVYRSSSGERFGSRRFSLP